MENLNNNQNNIKIPPKAPIAPKPQTSQNSGVSRPTMPTHTPKTSMSNSNVHNIPKPASSQAAQNLNSTLKPTTQTSQPVNIQSTIKNQKSTKSKTFLGVLMSLLFVFGLLIGVAIYKKDTPERKSFTTAWLISSIVLDILGIIACVIILLL